MNLLFQDLLVQLCQKFQPSCERQFTFFFSFVASYVSAMVPVKSPKEYYVQQEVIVLFCETVERYVYRRINALNNYSL